MGLLKGHSEEYKLAKGCAKGKPDCQRRLYETYSRKMMGVCLRYARDYIEAEDILQDGFIRVFNKIDTFKGKGSLEGWIRRVIVNVALRKVQERSRMVPLVNDDHCTDDSLIELASKDLEVQDLIKLIQRLPEGYRKVFNLYAIEGYSHKEISEKMGISEGTSKSQLSRARGYLKKWILEVNEYRFVEEL